MTQREKQLKEKGYHYWKSEEMLFTAKQTAKWIRDTFNYKATVLTEQRGGIPYYSVWVKR